MAWMDGNENAYRTAEGQKSLGKLQLERGSNGRMWPTLKY
jgi:hypothetical protein